MNDIEDSMKTIEVDDDIYRHIASHTEQIGESASDILRRLLSIPGVKDPQRVEKTDRLTTLPIEQLLAEGALKRETKAIARFMLILRTLYQSDPHRFQQATDIRGRKRVYFSLDPKELTSHGNTTKPKQVEGTPYWVISNTNTHRKKLIVEQIMIAMTYPAALIARVSQSI